MHDVLFDYFYHGLKYQKTRTLFIHIFKRGDVFMYYMKPKQTTAIPKGKSWLYEVKYDGFRAQLQWESDTIRLISRNGHDITRLFPEVVHFCQMYQPKIQSILPIILDGELVVLNHTYQANFAIIQQRGRLKNTDRINQASKKRRASFLAFDMFQHDAKSLENTPFLERKKLLKILFNTMDLPVDINPNGSLSYVPAVSNADELWGIVSENKAEGMIAKRKESIYHNGKQHHDWYKIKNWRQIEAFLTFYNVDNGYYTVHVYKDNDIRLVGKCKHGLGAEEENTLKTFFTTNGTKQNGGYALPPAICARIHSLDLYKNELREPKFATILAHYDAAKCTEEKLQLDMAMLPSAVNIKNTDKVFWPQAKRTKGDLLMYMREIAPYMLPFLKERLLTVIRAPDGVGAEHFFQKHLPDYAPSFIRSVENEGDTLMICDHLEALIWFANHGAVEYHTPFEQVSRESPSEIVFDLDPPDVNQFALAKQAALMLKQLLDDLDLVSFVKTSGNKGMQVHIPIPDGSMSYERTALLTKAIAETMVHTEPTLFTTERFKKDRNKRLYIDYVQHAAGKTIITPYSPRLTDAGSVATPLYWEEVTDDLHPDQFTIENVVQRVQTHGCPFALFFEVGKKQQLEKVQNMLDL